MIESLCEACAKADVSCPIYPVRGCTLCKEFACRADPAARKDAELLLAGAVRARSKGEGGGQWALLCRVINGGV